MSALQIRAHFLLYREWAARLHGRTDVRIGLSKGLMESRLQLDLAHFLQALGADHDVPHLEALSHSIMGLRRLDLLGEVFGWGNTAELGAGFKGPYEQSLNVTLTPQGIELYGWAQGRPGLSHQNFAVEAEVFAEEEIPRLTEIALPDLPEPNGDDGAVQLK